MRRRTLYLIAVAVLGLLVCGPRVVRFLRGDSRRDSWVRQWRAAYTLSADVESAGASRSADTIAELIVEGAKERARRAARYDASYRGIAFPMGDVPDDRGACTDVLIRSLRAAGIDMQELIHRDMSRDFSTGSRGTWSTGACLPARCTAGSSATGGARAADSWSCTTSGSAARRTAWGAGRSWPTSVIRRRRRRTGRDDPGPDGAGTASFASWRCAVRQNPPIRRPSLPSAPPPWWARPPAAVRRPQARARPCGGSCGRGGWR